MEVARTVKMLRPGVRNHPAICPVTKDGDHACNPVRLDLESIRMGNVE